MESKFKTKTKKVIQSGNSLIVILPQDYVRETGLRRGDTVSITYDGVLIILNPNLRRVYENNNAKSKTD